MDIDTLSTIDKTKQSLGSAKGTALLRNDKEWELLRQDIYRIYITENNTLEKTMGLIEVQYSFKASLRKWKDKLKEWGYEKHLSQSDMKILVAKGEKRLREEGKGTDFFHHGIEVPKKKIETFKKRKVVRESDPASPSASTPAAITYSSPQEAPINEEVENDLKPLLSSTSAEQSEQSEQPGHDLSILVETVDRIIDLVDLKLSHQGHAGFLRLISILTYLQVLDTYNTLPNDLEEVPEGMSVFVAMRKLGVTDNLNTSNNGYATTIPIFDDVVIGYLDQGHELLTFMTKKIDDLPPFSYLLQRQDYLQHEAKILQLALCAYLKKVIEMIDSGMEPVGKTCRACHIARRLRKLYTNKADLDEDWRTVDARLSDIEKYFSNHGFHHDCLQLFVVLCLANSYSVVYEFEAADNLFRLDSALRGPDNALLGKFKLDALNWEHAHNLRKSVRDFNAGSQSGKNARNASYNYSRVEDTPAWEVRFVPASFCQLLEEVGSGDAIEKGLAGNLNGINLMTDSESDATSDAAEKSFNDKFSSISLHMGYESKALSDAAENDPADDSSFINVDADSESSAENQVHSASDSDAESTEADLQISIMSEDGFTSSSMSSQKFGVTLSGSEFAGVNLSRYAVG